MLSLYLYVYVTERIMKKKTAGRNIRFVCMLIFLAGLLIGAYKSVHILNMNRVARESYKQMSADITYTTSADTREADAEETVKPDMPEPVSEEPERKRLKSIDFSKLQKDYPEISGWLCAPEIGIDYPVMHTTDNGFYLYHLPDGTYNENGTLFIDCKNERSFHDRNSVIYGHNMDSGAMFHSLNGYQKQDFYEKCPTMMLYTPEGDYRIELLCGTIESGDSTFVRLTFNNEDDFNEYTAQLMARSTFRSEAELQPGDRLLTMCTCNFNTRNGRYMLVGRMVELYEQ